MAGLLDRREKRWLGYFSMRSRLKISSSRPRDIWATFEISCARCGDIMNSHKLTTVGYKITVNSYYSDVMLLT